MRHTPSVACGIQSVNDFAECTKHLLDWFMVFTEVLKLRMVLPDLSEQLRNVRVLAKDNLLVRADSLQVTVQCCMHTVNGAKHSVVIGCACS